MPALARPYELLVAPLVPWLLLALVLFCATGIVLDQRAAARGRRDGALSELLTIAVLLLLGLGVLTPASAAGVGLIVGAHGVALYALARFDWFAAEVPRPPLPLWYGLAVIAAAFALECAALEAWPPHLNFYSAANGLEGIRALGGAWPEGFLRARHFDLVSGAQSPLMLPVVWASMKAFGGTVFALRFAEVAASTLLLLVVWIWLRDRMRGRWGLLALAVFAFSPWHLAQSRMGTLFSVSSAVAMALLWIAEKLRAPRAAPGWSIAFGACAGLIGWCYAPIKVLYAFVVLVLAGSWRAAWTRGERGGWRRPGLALLLWAPFLTVQLWGPGRFGDLLRDGTGGLATDTAIWRKTAGDVVTGDIQPPAVIARNLLSNGSEWLRLTYEELDVLPWHGPALSLAVLVATVVLARRRAWTLPAYFLIGLLPPLLFFPVPRRSLIVLPLVYVFGVAFLREIWRRADGLVAATWWRAFRSAAVSLALVVSTMQGLYLFATTNSVVQAGTYFGPNHRLDMIREAERLLPMCRVFFVDLDPIMQPDVHVRFYEPVRRLGREEAYGFVDLEKSGEWVGTLRRDEPLCFLHLIDREEDETMEEVERLLPGGTLVRRFDAGGESPLFSVYFLGREE